MSGILEQIARRTEVTGLLLGPDFKELIRHGFAPPWTPEQVSKGQVSADDYTEWLAQVNLESTGRPVNGEEKSDG